MATVNPTIDDLSGDGQVIKFVWNLTTANADGSPIGAKYANHADRTVYFIGSNWGGATAAWQGGDGSVWLPLTDSLNLAFSKTADGIDVVTEVPEFSRPNLTTPGTAAVITAVCIARRGYKRV